MEKTVAAKEAVIQLIVHHYGARVGQAFHDEYMEETLPIFLHSAVTFLEDFLGKDKAKTQLNQILAQNQVTGVYAQ